MSAYLIAGAVAFTRSVSQNRLEQSRLELNRAQIRDKKAATMERLSRIEQNQARTEVLRLQKQVLQKALFTQQNNPILVDETAIQVDYCPNCGEGYHKNLNATRCSNCGTSLVKAIGAIR